MFYFLKLHFMYYIRKGVQGNPGTNSRVCFDMGSCGTFNETLRPCRPLIVLHPNDWALFCTSDSAPQWRTRASIMHASLCFCVLIAYDLDSMFNGIKNTSVIGWLPLFPNLAIRRCSQQRSPGWENTRTLNLLHSWVQACICQNSVDSHFRFRYWASAVSMNLFVQVSVQVAPTVFIHVL